MSIPRVKDNHYKNGSVVVTWTVTYQQLKTSPLYCTVFCYLRGHLLIVYLIQIHYYSTGTTFVYVLLSLLLDQITIALQKFIRTSDYHKNTKGKNVPRCDREERWKESQIIFPDLIDKRSGCVPQDHKVAQLSLDQSTLATHRSF